MMSRIKENAWVLMVIFFMVCLFFMYKIVDDPETVGGYTDKYDVPQSVIDSAEKWGAEYGISPELLEAIAWTESNYNPNVSNSSGSCHGLMQISYSAHGQRMAELGVTDIFSLDGNMHVAADYLQELFEEYEDCPVVLAIYNGQSESKVNAAMYDGYMSDYAKDILEMAEELERMHGKKEIERKSNFGFNLVWENGVG